MTQKAPNSPAEILPRLHALEEDARIFGEQAWQLAALPFSIGFITPVFVSSPWRLTSFVAGMVLAALLWGIFKIRSWRASREARALKATLLQEEPPAESVQPG